MQYIIFLNSLHNLYQKVKTTIKNSSLQLAIIITSNLSAMLALYFKYFYLKKLLVINLILNNEIYYKSIKNILCNLFS